METAARYRGSLLGLALGDALGTTPEFRPPGTFTPVEDLVGGGPFGLEPGEWTDDTALALCLAESLVECGGFAPAAKRARYFPGYRAGYLSRTGRCCDSGEAVRPALPTFDFTGDPFAGATQTRSARNGSLMRLSPLIPRGPIA